MIDENFAEEPEEEILAPQPALPRGRRIDADAAGEAAAEGGTAALPAHEIWYLGSADVSEAPAEEIEEPAAAEELAEVELQAAASLKPSAEQAAVSETAEPVESAQDAGTQETAEPPSRRRLPGGCRAGNRRAGDREPETVAPEAGEPVAPVTQPVGRGTAT